MTGSEPSPSRPLSVRIRSLAARLRPSGPTLLWGGLLVNTELLLLGVSLSTRQGDVYAWFPTLMPFLWIDVALWVLVRTDLPPVPGRRRVGAAAVAGGYLLLLGTLGGVIVPDPALPTFGVDLSLSATPGWSPTLTLSTPLATVALVPWKVAGYGTLAYLVYAVALGAGGGLAGGLLGFASCVSCLVGLLASVVGGVGGAGAGLANALLGVNYPLSTAAWLVSVGLLYGAHAADWRLGAALADAFGDD